MNIGTWKTRVFGFSSLLAGIVEIIKTGSVDQASIAAITAGVGLLFARDNNVTSEQAGAKKV